MVGLPTWHFKEVVEKGMGLYPLILGLLKAEVWGKEFPGTLTTPATVRDRTYDSLTNVEKTREACDIIATNIVLQGLPQDIYNLVNYHAKAKDIRDRVYSLKVQKSRCRKRVKVLINDMHFIRMTMKPIQINTKFFNHLQPEWIKFVTDVKLAKDLYNTNFDHLYGYSRQHEAHANEVRQTRQQYSDPIALVYQPPDAHHSSVVHHQSHQAPIHQQPQASFLQLDSGLVVLSFLSTDDPIASLNKKMAFINTTFTSRYPPTNNQHRTSSNLRNQVKKRLFVAKTVKEEGHMARQCTKPKRPRNSAWFKDKVMLAEALESWVILDEEQKAFLADNGDTVTISHASQEISTPAAFQTDELDAFDSNCDEAPSASAVVIAKLFLYD
nr:hypothetical protein [Tanacetum cinerariifolium]